MRQLQWDRYLSKENHSLPRPQDTLMFMRVAVTGATGFIAGQLKTHLAPNGHEVIALSRRRPSDWDDWRHYTLDMPASKIDLADAEVVIHCAYDMRARGTDHLVINANSAVEIAEACRQTGARLLYVSSVVAAVPDASWYAKTKRNCEISIEQAEGVNIRLGLLKDSDFDPFAKKLVGISKRFSVPLIPVPKGWVWQSTLAEFFATVEQLVSQFSEAKYVWLGGSRPVSFGDHVRDVFKSSGMKRKVIELPLWFFLLVFHVAELFSGKRGVFSTDALRALGEKASKIVSPVSGDKKVPI